MKKEVWSDLTMEDKPMIVCQGTPNKSGTECLVFVKLKTGATTVVVARYVDALTEEAYYFFNE